MPLSPVTKEVPTISPTMPVVSHDEQALDSHDEKSNVEFSESSSCSLNDSGSSAEKSPIDLEQTKKPLRNLPKVNEIKQRFMLPSKYPLIPVSPTKEDLPKPRGNVKNMIAQMQAPSDTELPIVSTPSEEHAGGRRHSKTIQSKIDELTRLRSPKVEDAPEQKRSYTPPIVRRKVQSVFFEHTRSKSLEPKLNKSQENLADNTSKDVDTSRDQLAVLTNEAVKTTSEVCKKDVCSSFQVSKEEVNSTLQVPKEVNSSTEVTKEVDFSTEMTKEGDSHTEMTEEVNSSTEMTEQVNSSLKISKESSIQEKDEPIVSKTETKQTSDKDISQSKKDNIALYSENGDSHLVAFDILPQPPSRKKSPPEDIELGFKEDKVSRKSGKRLKKASSQDSFYETSSSRVGLMIGVKENGLYSPPQIVDTEDHPLKKSSEYDHLMKKSEYDHLAPLEPSNGIHYPHRHRSASDLGVHRIGRLSREEQQMMASEVSTVNSACCITIITSSHTCICISLFSGGTQGLYV